MKAKPVCIIILCFIAILFCASCHKEGSSINRPSQQQPPQPPPSPIPPVIPLTVPPGVDTTLSGKEFTFSSKWLFWTDAMGDDIYSNIEPISSFSMASLSYLPVAVSVQPDSISAWTDVPFWNWYNNNAAAPTITGFCWDFPHWPYYENEDFIIENYPFNYQLIGRALKVKVKFLN